MLWKRSQNLIKLGIRKFVRDNAKNTFIQSRGFLLRIFYLELIQIRSRLQCTEAEYMALSEVVKELKFIVQLLQTMNIEVKLPVTVH